MGNEIDYLLVGVFLSTICILNCVKSFHGSRATSWIKGIESGELDYRHSQTEVSDLLNSLCDLKSSLKMSAESSQHAISI